MGNINDSIVKRAATESLAHAAMQAPQQSTQAGVIYDNDAYREHYSSGVGGPNGPSLASQTPAYRGMAASSSHPYNIGHPIGLPQASTNNYTQHPYTTADETGMAAGHVAALTASANNTSQAPDEGFSYSHTPLPTNAHQPPYAANGFALQDWRQWTRTYAQMGQSGEYINTATTLMTLGRDNVANGTGTENQGLADNPGIQGHMAHHWPEITFPGAASHMGQQ